MTDYATSSRQAWILKPYRRSWPEWLELWDIALYGVLMVVVTAVLVVGVGS